MEKMVYGIVPMSIQDWKEGKIPHVQPGVDIKFEKLQSSATRSMDTYDEPFSLEPRTAILFEVPQSVVEKRAKESEERAIGHRWLGTLPARDIQRYSIYIANDVLNPLGTSFYQDVSRGEKPDYQQAYRMVAARAHSFETLNQILANTEPMHAADVLRELQVDSLIDDENPEVEALRDVLSSYGYPSSMCFRGADEIVWHGIMYTDNIGMDAAMRTIQNTVKEMAPKLDVRSIEKLCAVYFTALEAQDSMVQDQSPENLTKCINAALETFKRVLAPEFQHVVDETQRGLVHNIERVQQDMMAPETVVMRQAMQYAKAYDVPRRPHVMTEKLVFSPNKPLQGEEEIYNTYQSQLGETSGDLGKRMLEAAKATLEQVQESHMQLPNPIDLMFDRLLDKELDDMYDKYGITDFDPLDLNVPGDDAK